MRQLLDLGHIKHRRIGYIGDRNELNRVYAACNLVLVPSLEETFSNTCAEAMLCGAPVVGFRSGGIPEMIIDGQTGFLAEDFNQRTLGETIRKALEKEWDRKAIRMSLLSRFSMYENSQRHIELYRREQNRSKATEPSELMIRLTATDRFIHSYKTKAERRALTSDSAIDTKTALVSGCKKAIMWISENGYVCLTQLGNSLRHYVWLGGKTSPQSLAALKPVARIMLTDSSIIPKAYSGQSLQPLIEFPAILSSKGIYVTLSSTLDINVRSRDGDRLIASHEIVSQFQLLDDSAMVNTVF